MTTASTPSDSISSGIVYMLATPRVESFQIEHIENISIPRKFGLIGGEQEAIIVTPRQHLIVSETVKRNRKSSSPIPYFGHVVRSSGNCTRA